MLTFIITIMLTLLGSAAIFVAGIIFVLGATDDHDRAIVMAIFGASFFVLALIAAGLG